MSLEEKKYLELLQDILDNGEDRDDRTGVGTRSVFGRSLRFSLKDDTIPLLTTKKVYFKGVVEELLFFLRGETQTKKLEAKGVNIWKGNTSREFLDKRGLTWLPEGSYGKSYGYQMRNFNGNTPPEGSSEYGPRLIDLVTGVDQIKNVLDSLKNDPYGRRHLVSMWNPEQLNKMALPCCHYSFQFYVSNNKELSLIFNMRSTDSFLGLPFNCASYALLTHIFAECLGYSAKEIIYNGGDVHVYKNHFEAVKEQLGRDPYDFPKLKVNKELKNLKDIENLSFEDFQLINYKNYPSIKAEMAI